VTQVHKCEVRARLEARQGCRSQEFMTDERPFLVKLLDSDGRPFIDAREYKVFANYRIAPADWQELLAEAAMVRTALSHQLRRSFVFRESTANDWRVIDVELFSDSSVWVVDDDSLMPSLA
jgi:hypothetical protein